jgi:hypothetical protein
MNGTVPPVKLAGHVDQLIAFIVAEDDGIKVTGAGREPANHRLLPLVDAHFLPSTRMLSRLVPAVAPLGNQPLQPLRLD